MMRTKFLTALLVGAALLGTAATADAKVIALRARSGFDAVNDIQVFGGATGNVAVAGTINGVNVAANGTSTEAPNNISLSINTAGTNLTNTVRTVTYFLTVTGLTNQPSIQGWQDLFNGVNAGVHDSSAVVHVFMDPGNHLFNANTLIYDSGFPAGCGFPPAYSCSTTGSITLPSTPFSLTEVVTISYKVGSQGQLVTSSNSFAAVPEPTSLALLGSGLLLAGWMFRRRRGDKTA